jgi:hypothetical protein
MAKWDLSKKETLKYIIINKNTKNIKTFFGGAVNYSRIFAFRGGSRNLIPAKSEELTVITLTLQCSSVLYRLQHAV